MKLYPITSINIRCFVQQQNKKPLFLCFVLAYYYFCNMKLISWNVNGLRATNDLQQAKDRAGGRLGNKGDECAIVAIKMAKF